jgi:hypothetical protein
MTINSASLALSEKMNFAAAVPTKGEKALAGLLSNAFIADAAKIVNPLFAGVIKTDLTALKAALLSGASVSQLRSALIADFGTLAEAGVNSPYNYTAGKALAAMITPARTNALYGFLPANTISKTDFNTDIAKLKTGLSTGQGFSELFQIF